MYRVKPFATRFLVGVWGTAIFAFLAIVFTGLGWLGWEAGLLAATLAWPIAGCFVVVTLQGTTYRKEEEMAGHVWEHIRDAKAAGHHDGREVWLGWKPFEQPENDLTDGTCNRRVCPRIGYWDVGSNQWVAHFEDRGSPDGLTPQPFTPQPDYFCEGFIPPAPDR